MISLDFERCEMCGGQDDLFDCESCGKTICTKCQDGGLCDECSEDMDGLFYGDW